MSEQSRDGDATASGTSPDPSPVRSATKLGLPPHAYPTPPGRPLSAVARFWRGRGVRIAFGLGLVVSLGAHLAAFPWHLLPDDSVQFKDVDDELSIPTDLIEDEAPAPPPKVDPVVPSTPGADPVSSGAGKPDAAPPPKKRDAGVTDAEVADARIGDAAIADADLDDARPTDAAANDAGAVVATDGAVPTSDIVDGGGSGDGGGLIAMVDAGGPAPGAGGPRDPGSMIGMAGLVAAGTVNVTLLVNMQVIRSHPIGQKIGPLLGGLPQWNDFIRGNETNFEPLRDTDWMLIYGPSLIHTDRDAMLIRYTVADSVVDHAIDLVSQKAQNGGPFDAGVSGVKATLGHADNAPRVFLRAQPHVLAIVPPDKAALFAKVLKARTVSPKVRPGEALRLVVRDPHRQIAIRGLKFPEELKELRLWVIPRADGGADVYGEGDCTTPEAAVSAAQVLTDVIARTNSGIVQMGTGGLLNGAKVDADGTGLKLHVSASRTQLERVLGTVALLLGVELK